MKFVVGLAAAAVGLALAGAASASQVIITDVEAGNPYTGNVSVAGWGNPWTTPILMTDDQGHVNIVFCDDLQHDVYIGSGQHLPYHVGLVTKDGAGNDLTQAVSNKIGQLADAGEWDYLHGNEKAAIAAQAAIWGIEYNIAVSSTDAGVQSYILQYLQVQDNGRGWATGLIADGGTQSQLLGGVPEPSTWAMMMVGVFGLGAMLRSRRKDQLSAIEA
jgi:hypothetical protein